MASARQKILVKRTAYQSQETATVGRAAFALTALKFALDFARPALIRWFKDRYKDQFHTAKSLNWCHFEPEYLLTLSPDLNPIERLWLRIKADWFNGWIAKSADQLQDHIIEALRSLFDQPHIRQPQCRPKKNL